MRQLSVYTDQEKRHWTWKGELWFLLKQDYIFNRQAYQFVTAIVVHKQQNDMTLMSIHFLHSL